SRIDFGAPGARARLWSGWGPDEQGPEGSFAWGHGERSSLTVDLVEPRDLRLVLRGWSFPFADDPPQQVTVSVNGEELGRRWVPTRPTEIEFEVPAKLWRSGENRVELGAARVHRARGEPAWSVAWDALRLGGVAEPEAVPELDAAGGRVLPAGTALEWTLDLPGGAWLAWAGLVANDGARLEIAVRTEGEEDEQTGEFGSGAGRFRASADGAPHRLRRISLRCPPGRGRVVLAGGRLHAPGLDLEPAAAVQRAGALPPAPRPNVLVYVIDTLRADRLGCYGYPRGTSPRIDAFARGAARFREGWAQSSWTRPAMASLLTGLLPITHQAEDTSDRIPERVETLAERLARTGYATAMITTNGNVAARFGFRQGFSEFRYLPERRKSREVHVQSDEVNREVFAWLDRRDPARPFFLVVHTTDPHDPYTPGRELRERLAPGIDPEIGWVREMRRAEQMTGEEARSRAEQASLLYDGEIAANDASFGALLDRLERLGLDGTTAIFLTSDHGEEFWEHGGWTHGKTLYEEQLRIPFLVRLPSGAGAGTAPQGPAEQIDLAPTVLELAGIARPREMPGRSLLAEIEAGGERRNGASLAFLVHGRNRGDAVLLSEWKLIRTERTESLLLRPPLELYALGSDPAESRNRVLERDLRRTWLEGELRAAEGLFRSRLPRARPVRIDRELADRLRALGYLR
ncbi:MAG TPA: sulfatase, partial [Thermoanaerobaculia bacterium]|nr:sulfatase [Thermoanaerobaculia bacterium]